MERLAEIREELAALDEQLLLKFAQRMQLVEEVAAIKRKVNGAIFVPEVEERKIEMTRRAVGSELADYAQVLMQTLLRLSRAKQYELNWEKDHAWPLAQAVQTAKKEADEVAEQDILTWTEETPILLEQRQLYIYARTKERVAVSPQLKFAPEAERGSLLLYQPQPREKFIDALNIFADLQIPVFEVRLFEDCFFVEFAAIPENKRALRALYQLEQETERMQFLGWYPCLREDELG